MDEKVIYAEQAKSRRFRRRFTLTLLLCFVGLVSYTGFLGYRHHHPIDTTPTQVEQRHPQCPHPECASHKVTERPVDYATPVLAGFLMLYLAVVGIGSFWVEID